jgi:nitrogen fixation protein NifU and related proteins
MTITSIAALFGVLLLFVLTWYGLSYMLSPHMEAPDGIAKITGNCGDTMELGVQIKNGIIVRTHHWTDGCTMSRNCIEAAARLAYGKSPMDLRSINMSHIIDDIGQIPDSHLHCAQLAEITMQKALDDYFSRDTRP